MDHNKSAGKRVDNAIKRSLQYRPFTRRFISLTICREPTFGQTNPANWVINRRQGLTSSENHTYQGHLPGSQQFWHTTAGSQQFQQTYGGR
jgi:hypothetical protein